MKNFELVVEVRHVLFKMWTLAPVDGSTASPNGEGHRADPPHPRILGHCSVGEITPAAVFNAKQNGQLRHLVNTKITKSRLNNFSGGLECHCHSVR